MERTIRILAIDGGGIRGLVPALFLARLEELTGRPLVEQFDLVAGTSTGGIMTLLLACPGADGRPRYGARDVVGLYTEHGKDLFFRSPEYQQQSKDGWALPKYPASSVTSTLGAYLGDAQLEDAVGEVLVTAYDCDRRQAVHFDRRGARDGSANFYMRDVARATSAFPGLFPAAEITDVAGTRTLHLIDGGVVNANPAVEALAHARRLFGTDTKPLLVSVGTGEHVAPLPFAQIESWGLQAWAPQLVDVLFAGASRGADESLAEGLEPGSYYRFQVQLPAEHDGTDDVSPANIDALRGIVADALSGKRAAGALDAGGSPWPALLDRLLPRLAEARG